MIQWFFFFYLLFWWVMCIIYKVTDIQNPNGKIREYVQLKPRESKFWDFVDKLFQCEFCMESHIGFCLSLPIFLYTQYWEIFFWGWCAASLSNQIKQISPK